MRENIPRQYANRLVGWKGTMWDNYAVLEDDEVRDWVLENETGLSEKPAEQVQRLLGEALALIETNPDLAPEFEVRGSFQPGLDRRDHIKWERKK